MPRQKRIELPGAFYHCSARGLGKRSIVLDDEDRNAHEILVNQVVQRTGWEIYAWALLDDHYHLVLRTPEANLVAGMKWFQNFWTKRFNARHRRSGSVFGGRYKSVVVQQDGHLSSLIDHVHLNTFRLGLVDVAKLAAYPWSSLKDYLLPPADRRTWIRAAEGLVHMGYDGGNFEEQLRYLNHLEQVAIHFSGRSRLPGPGRTLHSTLRRGWYLGEGSFRKKLLESRQQPGSPTEERQKRRHGAEMAQRLLSAGLAASGLTYEGLENLRKSDWRKRAIGRAIRLSTTVPTEWIAANLQMGASSRTALLVASDPEPAWGRTWRAASELLGRLLDLAHPHVTASCHDMPVADPSALDHHPVESSALCLKHLAHDGARHLPPSGELASQ